MLDTIPGPSGDLECQVDDSRQTETGAMAVLCHPHPLYGGSMRDQALAMIQQPLADHAYGTVRFNFRGVGASDGQHDAGVGEIDDVIAAIRWTTQRYSPETVLLGGYSFGAVMALQAQPSISVDRMVLLAPAIGMLETRPAVPGVETLILLGENDSFVDVDEIRSSLGGDGIRIEVIAQADHFFMGAQGKINELISDWLSSST